LSVVVCLTESAVQQAEVLGCVKIVLKLKGNTFDTQPFGRVLKFCMNPALFIHPAREAIERATQSWQWLPIDGREPLLVTAFGDIFFTGEDGVWFLDTLGGTFDRICSTRAELEELLASTERQDRYCLAGFVERACREGMTLRDGQCYDFKMNPVVGGEIEYANIQPRDFVVAVHIAGQLHEQIRQFPPGTKITRFVPKE
jgi:hypothetical protein